MKLVLILSSLVVIGLSIFAAYSFKLYNGVPKFKDKEIGVSNVKFTHSNFLL